MQHFITISNLNPSAFLTLLEKAQNFIDHGHLIEKPLLRGQTLATLFFEPSTRTQASFELAAKRLDADVLNLSLANSSTQKGETLVDTVKNLEAMGVNFFVLRHTDTVMEHVAAILNRETHLISAGEGKLHHPSQALLDMLTIQQAQPKFENLSVAIVGDILHSRVARSDIEALKLLGCQDIRLISPENLQATDLLGVQHETDMDRGLANADVVIMLRIQKERMFDIQIDSEAAYIEHYQLNQARLALAKPNAIVMHPGPINRGIEITNDVADGLQSVILKQARNGVAARMAILSACAAD